MEADPRRLLAQLAVAVIVADGRVTPGELEAVTRLDELGLGRLSGLVDEELRNASRGSIDVAGTCEQLRARVPQAGPVVLAALAELAAADRALSETELALLGETASRLGLTSAEAQQILTSVLAASSPKGGGGAAPAAPPEPGVPPVHVPAAGRALAVLGLDDSAGRAELDASFRRLVERYDPAKVIELGPDFAVLAIRKLGEISDAYELAAAALESAD